MPISPTPPIQSFERLKITDGLMITPERWKSTHAYHRQRQNFYFQSLHQPGIVCGLGVTLAKAVDLELTDIKARDRDGRWLKIQPGIAIDAAGNPIVVTQPEIFQIRATPSAQEKTLVYLVINYVDPDGLRPSPTQEVLAEPVSETVFETFHIVEKTTLEPLDIELCRIELTAHVQTLSLATDVYQPISNTLDHRYRLPVKQRPQKSVRVAQVTTDDTSKDDTIQKGLNYLLQATDTLYPKLQTEEGVQPLSLGSLTESALASYDLIVCPYMRINDLVKVTFPIQQYLLNGGVLCIYVEVSGTHLEKLNTIRQELLLALSELNSTPAQNTLENALMPEIKATNTDINQHIQKICRTILQLAARIEYPVEGAGGLDPTHPLLTAPFLFAQPPKINHQPTHVFCWGGLVLMISNLANAWALNEQLLLSRESIRTTQEWGINLLEFGWRRHHLTQLQKYEGLTNG